MRKAKSLSKLKKEALDLFSKIIKLRYAVRGELRCFTCGSPIQISTSNCHAGHYLSRGAYPGLTFHEDNIRVQDYRCNCHLHGATPEFRIRLIDEIGIERVEALESSRHTQVKYSRNDYLEMIQKFKEEIQILESDFNTF